MSDLPEILETVVVGPADRLVDEPEPGAYLIGDVLCVHMAKRGGQPWLADTDRPELRLRMDWASLVVFLGIGPDTTIRRLVPAPEPVTLPWVSQQQDVHGRRVVVTRLGGGPVVAVQSKDGTEVGCYVPDWRDVIAALTTAAGGGA